jgi:hypothetical protein
MSPVSSTEITSMPVKWLRIPEAIRYSGLSRSFLYQLIADGRIKSACIRKKGSVRGVRILSAESIDAFMLKLQEETEQAEQPATDYEPAAARKVFF